MAFDQPTRNRLNNFVGQARSLLTEEFTRQMQSDYGIDPGSGRVDDVAGIVHLDDRQRETARILRDTLHHYSAAKKDEKTRIAAIDRIVREQAFTVLNRLAALRMMEARGLLITSIAEGARSDGFQLYQRLAGVALGETDEAYVAYLFSLLDEFAVDLPVLFDRFSPQGRLFPGGRVLRQLLGMINDGEIAPLWAEDETIGWIYQYFNSKEERQQMRKASQAPRNSRELAVRNQFFTPRYVVEFLTDNTLGRIWYEMTKGETRLVEECRYMVRRPTEVFLPDPDKPLAGAPRHSWVQAVARGDFSRLPDDPSADELHELSLVIDGYQLAEKHGYGDCIDWADRQLERYRAEAVWPESSLELWLILFRLQRYHGRATMVEPEMTGLGRRAYLAFKRAFEQEDLSQEELLRQPVYIPHRPLKDPREIKMLDPACGSMHFGLYAFDLFETIYEEAWEMGMLGEWAAEYHDKAAFMRDVPRLIIEHNIHGIDIDARAVQIAGLSLWLRAQRGWQAQRVEARNRPTIARSNVVVAEPMPGDEAELEAFLGDQLEDTTQDRIVAGLVRRIFEAMKLAGEAGSLLKIEEEIAEDIAATKERWKAQPKAQQASLFERPMQTAIPEDALTVTDEQFWEEAEGHIYAALEKFSEQAGRNESYRRRLFVDDAARGFAFIDVCRKCYDVVLMNPPFGEASVKARGYLYKAVKDSARDILAAFVSRFNLRLTLQGRLGVLSNRTVFFSDFLADWRLANLYGDRAFLSIVADLGYGVLDALVEAAAYVCQHELSDQCLILDILSLEAKALYLREFVQETESGEPAHLYIRNLTSLSQLPKSKLLFRLDPFWVRRLNLSEHHPLFAAKAGLTTGDDFKNLRTLWEVKYSDIGGRWKWLAKGGDYEKYRSNLHLCVDSRNKEFLSRTRNDELYELGGLTYTERTTSNLSVRVLNEGAWFSGPGPGIIPRNKQNRHYLLAYMNSFAVSFYIESIVGGGDFSVKGTAARHLEPGYFKYLPALESSEAESTWFQDKIQRLLSILDKLVEDETDPRFTTITLNSQVNLNIGSTEATRQQFSLLSDAYQLIQHMEYRFQQIFHIPAEQLDSVYSDTGWPWREGAPPSSTLTDLRLTDPAQPRRYTYDQVEEVSLRFISKLSHYLNSEIERYAALNNTSPVEVSKLLATDFRPSNELMNARVKALHSYILGCLLGRWDIRHATGKTKPCPLPDPFDVLPVCPPGMLQNAEGLPVKPEDVTDDYPLRITWGGILVNDDGHPEDIIFRVREALHFLWRERADVVEADTCSLLGVDTLRDYFADPNNFFDDHLSRYSKSRRAAPIYWPLTTTNGSYTLWLYYHRLHAGTLYQCVNDFVDPRLAAIQRQLNGLRSRQRSRDDERELERLTDLGVELEAFRKDLLELARFWRPNLNDGVEITAAPLYALFGHRTWRERLEGTWQKLQEGEYDWAHLAMSIWPSRVVPKCIKDRSLAIAHDIEKLFWVEEDDSWRPLRSPAEEEAHQMEIRQSENRDSLRNLFTELASDEGRYLPAMQVWQSLDEGQWDHRPLGLHLYPERAAAAAFDDATRVYSNLDQQGQKLLQKDTKKNRQLLTQRLVGRGTPELVAAVEAALADEPSAFATLWRALESGKRDDQPLALALWPKRVIGKVLRDPDLAAQHGLFDFFWYDEPGTGIRRRQPIDREIAHEVERRGGDRL